MVCVGVWPPEANIYRISTRIFHGLEQLFSAFDLAEEGNKIQNGLLLARILGAISHCIHVIRATSYSTQQPKKENISH